LYFSSDPFSGACHTNPSRDREEAVECSAQFAARRLPLSGFHPFLYGRAISRVCFNPSIENFAATARSRARLG
jgi:hypothetical protein